MLNLSLKDEIQLQNENHTEDWALGSHPRDNGHVPVEKPTILFLSKTIPLIKHLSSHLSLLLVFVTSPTREQEKYLCLLHCFPTPELEKVFSFGNIYISVEINILQNFQ